MRKNVQKSLNMSDINLADLTPGDFITTEMAAQILGVSSGTLEVWRHQGKGPAFYKIEHAVRYYKPLLKKYLFKQFRMSTSDQGGF